MSRASRIGDMLNLSGVIEVRSRDTNKISAILKHNGIDSHNYGVPMFGSTINFQVKREDYQTAWNILISRGVEIVR